MNYYFFIHFLYITWKILYVEHNGGETNKQTKKETNNPPPKCLDAESSLEGLFVFECASCQSFY